MKYLLIALTTFLLFSCSKKKDPIITFTVTQNAIGEVIITANVDKISVKDMNAVGCTNSMLMNHDISSNQFFVNSDDITSSTIELNCTKNGQTFTPGQTYYFTCFVGTKNGKLVRSAPISFTPGNIAPCSINQNQYSFSIYSSWNASTFTFESGTTSTANLISTSGNYRTYSFQLGTKNYCITFNGEPSSKVYLTTTLTTAFLTNQVKIYNANSSVPIYANYYVFVKNNNDGTFTMTMCESDTYDATIQTSSNFSIAFKVNGNY
ncbi:MAG: hypothetical protein RL207_2111 [Bacteroidota bacterium]|jgi:hypothetical protein